MRIHQSVKILLLAFAMVFAAGSSSYLFAQDVIRASGGMGISIDTFYSGQYTSISGPTIRETAVGQLTQGNTIVLTLPAGFEWNTALTGANITITIAPVGAQNTDLEVAFTSISAQNATFTVTAQSRSTGAGRGPGRVTIEGLQLRPANGQIPNTGTITNTGTTGPTANYGDLSTKVGVISDVLVETSPDGTGEVVQAQNLQAGNSLTVYSIARDQGGNFLQNIALLDASDWILSSITGGITLANLNAATDRRSATFSSQLTGSAVIEALFDGANEVPSGTITVTPRNAVSMAINTQPSPTAVAGTPFATQPVLFLLDQFGNKVSNDQTTEVSASIQTGVGDLFGTTTQSATDGEIIFSDLFAEIAEDITIEFSNPDLPNIVSNSVTIEPADIAQIAFTTVPTSGNQGVTLSPITVQLYDAFDNEVSQSGVQINTSINSGGGQLQGTREVSTNATGEAIFDDLRFNTQGFKTILTELNSDATINDVSSQIEIFGSDALSGFRITATDEEPLGTQTAGAAFDIRIEAINGVGDVVTDYDGTVTISSSSVLTEGDGETAAFVNGILESHTVTLTTSGAQTLTATDTNNTNIIGTSSEFTVNPGAIDFTNTLLTANPANIVADGVTTSLVTVQLRDEFENSLNIGGETISLATTAGTLSTTDESGETSLVAEDNSDGTYTATLTSSTTVESATVTATENSTEIATVDVNFTPGGVNAFIISVPQNGGSPETQTAGEPFLISVEAVDANNNRVTDYSGTLNFSSNSVISSGGDNISISDGILVGHSITLTQSGTDRTISVEDPNLFGITGTSEPFTVIANDLDLGTSQVVANPVLIQNDGTSQSIITITLRDAFSNRILTDQSGILSITLEQLSQNGNLTGNTPPNATISGITFNSGNSTYTATLTSTTTVERVEVTIDADGIGELTSKATINIVFPKVWSPSGAPNQRNDWTRAENWDPQGQPGPEDFVVIPGNAADFPDLDLNVVIGSLEVEVGAQLVLFGGNSIDIAGNALINGTFDIEDNTNLNIGGNFIGSGTFASGADAEIELQGNMSITNFLARTDGTVLRLNGSTQQTVTTPNLLAQRLEILNDVEFTSGDIIDTNEILVSAGNSMILQQDADITIDNIQNIFGDGSLILNNNTLVVRGDLSLLNIDTSEGTVVFGIRVGEDPADFPNLSQQQIANLSAMKSAVINNVEGVRTFDDIIISDDGDITLENGELIIASGRNFIASNIIYNNGTLRFNRSVSQPGWKMLSTPVGTSYADFFNGLTLQGIPGAAFTDRQPNLLYYDETFAGTDNQRWRTPANASDSFTEGRGYFFYVFGNVNGDGDYNDVLPKTLSASGIENTPQTSEFSFPVTYTAEADTGWNMVGNPFGATIDWDDTGWTKTNMDNVLYIWDANSGEYKYWNGSAGSHGSGRIAPFQGFWVKANAADPVLEVNPSVKTVGGTFRKELDRYNDVPVLAFRLESDFHTANTHFSFTEKGSFNTDPMDAYRLLPFETNTYLEVYSLFKDGTELAINNLPRDFGAVIEIPVQVGAIKDGSPYSGLVSLTWPEFDNIPDSWTLELYDHHTKETINLRERDFYDFEIRGQGKGVSEKNTIQNFRLIEKSSSNAANSRFTLYIAPGSDGSEFPATLELNQNYPNPFNPTTTINFALPAEDQVRIDVYDLLGRRVQTITNQRYQAGYYQVEFDGRGLSSGVYFYRLSTSNKVLDKRMTLIK